MKNFGIISAILSKPWLIEQGWAKNNLPYIASLLQGNNTLIVNGKDESDNSQTHADDIPEKGHKIYSDVEAGSPYKAGRYNSFDEAPEGSIALIQISGPITKGSGNCGEAGSAQMSEWIKQANASSKISSIILKIDSPGGMVDGTASLADAIKASTKPVIGFVDDGMMASAAMWIGSAADEIYASQKTDTIGSIGVYTSIADFSGYYEQLGINVKDIYAPQSTDKNKDYRDALAGDESGIKANLKFIADQFIKAIKANRKGKINLEAGNPFTGKMFVAEDAQAVGLIDGIKSFEQVLQRAEELSKTSNSNHTQTNNNMFKIKHTWGALIAALGFTASADQKDLEVKAEDFNGEKLNETLSRVATLETENTALKAAVSDGEKNLSDVSVKLSASEAAATAKDAEIAGLNAKIAELGTQAGAMGTNPKKDGTDPIEAGKSFLDASADHNQMANSIGK